MTDNILDDSETRNGELCWHRMKGVNFNAINDGHVLDKAAYYILKKYFHDKTYYPDLLDELQEVTIIQLIGQALAMQSQGT
jgi:farnesyl diphosphate synthase